ncbi:class I adenylate-forming enzyme family protein [Pseudoxanthomonas sp. 10H]|uniref:class I adenylate-forming enzyme family protein n=1 Tax=Pseudoxanthomonas sp. 10H TaxID=3242729 RepID=UPI003558854A
MTLVSRLSERWKGISTPFLVYGDRELHFSDIEQDQSIDLSQVRPGDVVALIGDFEPASISALLRLIDLNAILVPLTRETAHDHEYFFDTAGVDVVVDGTRTHRRTNAGANPLVEQLREQRHAGLVLFSTGTTGRPKAILHDMTLFLRRFETPRPTFRTLNFLLFDHIGGINTLLHTIFNRGVVISPTDRTVSGVLETCRRYEVEVLPTTPTFLRMILMSGLTRTFPPSVRVITYGTERMDQPTLQELCDLLPDVDFRQTFGMSELGILRVKSEARDSLFMKIGGEGVETRIDDGVLKIKSSTRMLGYLNAPSPFDADGWYDTKDIVESRDGMIKVTGRVSDVINVGGLKFMPSEIERHALEFPGVSQAKAVARNNPITGQHVELLVEENQGAEVDLAGLRQFLAERLQPHMRPHRVKLGTVQVGHRFKKS